MYRLLPLLLVCAAAVPATAQAARPGTLDRGFGTRGVATTKLLDGGWAAALDRGGRILVAGGIQNPGVLRLTARGRRDLRFGRRGVATANRRDLLPFGIRRGRDGVIRVATQTTILNAPPVELLRFGRRGDRLPARVHAETFYGPIVSAVQRRDGGAYAASADVAIRAVAPGGGLDRRFGGDGTVEPTPEAGRSDAPIAVRPDGRLLVSASRGRLLQLRRDGTRDRSFGDGGYARVPATPRALRVARGGEIVGAASTGAFRVSRSGRLRRGFGERGIADYGIAGDGQEVQDVAADARGRVYVLMDFRYDDRFSTVVAFNRAGRRIRGFGDGGFARLPEPRRRYATNFGSRLLLDRRGGLLVVGARYADGLSHPAFGCDIREDLCASEVRLAVWRLHR